MRKLDLWVGRVATLMAWLSAGCVMVIAGLMTIDVVIRNTTGASVPGLYELVGTVLVMVVFLGLIYAERTRTNVRLTLLTSNLSRRGGEAVRILGQIVTLIIISWYTYATWLDAGRATARGDITQGLIQYPIWPAKLVIAFGFSLLLVQVISGIVQSVIRVASAETPVDLNETSEAL